MRIPGYIRKEQLRGGMIERPVRPFIVRPDDYLVIDGDTISIRAPKNDGSRGSTEAFRVRFCSIDTPEKPARQASDKMLEAIGIDPNADHIGVLATNYLKKITKRRALLVIFPPGSGEFGNGKYDRLIAEVIISGKPGKNFELSGAYSAQHEMLTKGHAIILPDASPTEPVPDYLEALKRKFTEKNEELSM